MVSSSCWVVGVVVVLLVADSAEAAFCNGPTSQQQRLPLRPPAIISRRTSTVRYLVGDDDNSASEPSSSSEELAYLKQELLAYLEKRKELGADEAAKETVGKVIGGTKGNKILEYVSGAPNKPKIAEEPPNPLDYDELTKYGYGNLVTPIMKAGGRLKMYELLNLDAPAVKTKKVIKSAPPLKIDRLGEETRYQGLRLGQVVDDEQQAMALEDVQRKVEKGERPSASKVLEEVEDFERPFADKRNVGPRQTPDWTPEKLDEWGKMQGRVEAWSRAAKEGAFVKDPLEQLDSLSSLQRFFSIVTALTTAVAFGRATPGFLSLLGANEFSTQLNLLQISALSLVLASVGSSTFCAYTAASRNRDQVVWAVKGLLGGPLSVRQIVDLPALQTQKQLQQQQDEEEQGRERTTE